MLVPCHDHVALAEALVSLHNNKQQREIFGKAAQMTAHQTFDLKMMVANNESIYREFIKQQILAA